MAKAKKKKSKKAAKAVKAKKAPMKKTKAATKKTAAKKKSGKKIVKAKAKGKKPAPRKAADRKPAKKKTSRQKMIGEGDYQASRTFLKDQAGFVKKNKARIPEMGKQAEMALEGPEGAALRAAEAEAASHSKAAE